MCCLSLLTDKRDAINDVRNGGVCDQYSLCVWVRSAMFQNDTSASEIISKVSAEC